LTIRPIVLVVALAGYPDVTKPTQSVLVSWSRPPKPPLAPVIPVTDTPYIETTLEGERLPYCRRSGQLFVLECPAGHRSAKHLPCGQLDCLTCRDGASFRTKKRRKVGAVGRRRGAALYHRFGRPELAGWVFTWPGARSLDCAQVADLRRMVHDGIAAFYRHFWDVAVGVYTFVHPCGGLTQSWQPHAHAQVPLLGLRAGRLVSLSGWMDQGHLDAMRGIAQQIQTRAGLTGAAQVHYRYSAIEHKKLHHLSYDGRSFPAWYAGDMPHSLKIGRPSGLLAPRCRLEGIERWRAAVSIPLADRPRTPQPATELTRIRQGLRCYACDAVPKIVEVLPAELWDLRAGPIVDAWGFVADSPEHRSMERQFGILSLRLHRPEPIPPPPDDMPPGPIARPGQDGIPY